MGAMPFAAMPGKNNSIAGKARSYGARAALSSLPWRIDPWEG